MSKIYFENAPVQETGFSSHNHVDGVHCARFKVQMINKSGPALGEPSNEIFGNFCPNQVTESWDTQKN